MNANYSFSLIADSKPRRRQKLNLVGLKDCPFCLPADIWGNNPVQCPKIEYLDTYGCLINTFGKSEKTTKFIVFLFDILDFLLLKRLIEELQTIITKKQQIVKFCQIIGFWLLLKLAWYQQLATYHRFTTIVLTLVFIS